MFGTFCRVDVTINFHVSQQFTELTDLFQCQYLFEILPVTYTIQYHPPTQRHVEVTRAADDSSGSAGDTSDDSSSDSDPDDRISSKFPARHPRFFPRPGSEQQQQRRRLALPLFLMELSSFRETHATLPSKADCIAYAESFIKQKSSSKTSGSGSGSGSGCYMCVAPLYEWLALEESTLRELSVQTAAIPDKKHSLNINFPSGVSSRIGDTKCALPSYLHVHEGTSHNLSFGPSKDLLNGTVGVAARKHLHATASTSQVTHAHQTHQTGNSKHSGSNNGSGLGFGFALGGTQEAKNKRAAMLSHLIEARRAILLEHDSLCQNEEMNRKREERSSRFHLLPSVVCPTTETCSQYDISLAIKRRSTTKQQIKLLSALVSSAPQRTVQVSVADGSNRLR